MIWEHEQIGLVVPMPPAIQPRKVWKHLHAPSERWSELVRGGTDRLLAAADRCGCPPRDQYVPEENFVPSCAGALRSQHDNYWVAAYGAELMATGTLCGRSTVDGRWVLASKRGVFLVATGGTPARVLSAYRPHPLGLDVVYVENDFVNAAVRRWERQTGMRSMDILKRLSERPDTPTAAWRLAVAVAESGVSLDPEVVGARLVAERRLAALTDRARALALPSKNDVVDGLDDVVREDDGDPVGPVLDVADAVAVTDVLVGKVAADELVDQLLPLLDWASPSWSELGEIADREATTTAGAVQRFWRAVGETAVGVTLTELGGVHRPVARLAARLTAPPWWTPILETLDAIGDRVHSIARDSVSNWSLAAQEMSGSSTGWEVLPPADLRETPGVQAFVVDKENPAGQDVTDLLAEVGPIWNLERPGQEARIVIVKGADLAGSLGEALAAAAADDGIEVTVIEVSRPR